MGKGMKFIREDARRGSNISLPEEIDSMVDLENYVFTGVIKNRE